MKQVYLGETRLSAPPNTVKPPFGVGSMSRRRAPVAPSREHLNRSWRLAACPFLHPSQSLQEPPKQVRPPVSGTDLWQRLTPCLFSKAASALRAAPWHIDASNAANTQRSLPALDAYVERVKALMASIKDAPGGLTTDGSLRAALAQQVPDMFAFEAPADHIGSSVADLARWTRDVLTAICPESVATLKNLRADAHGHFADDGWHFTYSGVPFFVLASSPAYGPQSSRYSGGHRQKNVILHLQPLIIFKLKYAAFGLTSSEAKAINRKRFATAKKPYGGADAMHENVHDAAKVIPPMSHMAPHVAWWR